MATKYGDAAIRALAKIKAKFQARKKLIFGIVGVVIAVLVVDHYLF
jgi:hypothetical protein